MQAVILAGGLGTRISEESGMRPKPMIEIGRRPLLWHIMKIYAAYGIHDFIICCGYKGYMIKEYFCNYFLHQSDITVDLGNNSLSVHNPCAEPWKVTMVDTGELTQTGGRLKAVASYLHDTFCMTYGDGVAALDITNLLEFHRRHGKLATMTAAQPPARFGALQVQGTKVNSFVEKPLGTGNWINGGFFVLQKEVLTLIEGEQTLWEKSPLETLAQQGQLEAFLHEGFWQPMDTLRDKKLLEDLWATGQAPWKVWS